MKKINNPYNFLEIDTICENLAADKRFNDDIHTQVLSNLDQQITLLSGFFGAFVAVEYVIDSSTYRQTNCLVGMASLLMIISTGWD